jgi:carboxylesterase type B
MLVIFRIDLDFLSQLMAKYDEDLSALVPNGMNVKSELKNEAGAAIRQLYSGDDLLQNVPAAGVRYMSDTTFTRAVIKHASIQSGYSDVYFYQFSYDGKIGNVSVIVEGADRVGHNEENAYLWRIRNDMFDNYNFTIYPESDITTHNRLITLWTNFAKSMNPTPEKIYLLQNITWPVVSLEDNFPYLNIDENLEIKNYPKEASFSGWSQIYETYGQGPYDTY